VHSDPHESRRAETFNSEPMASDVPHKVPEIMPNRHVPRPHPPSALIVRSRPSALASVSRSRASNGNENPRNKQSWRSSNPHRRCPHHPTPSRSNGTFLLVRRSGVRQVNRADEQEPIAGKPVVTIIRGRLGTRRSDLLPMNYSLIQRHRLTDWFSIPGHQTSFWKAATLTNGNNTCCSRVPRDSQDPRTARFFLYGLYSDR
jgi:hypothetical protein